MLTRREFGKLALVARRSGRPEGRSAATVALARARRSTVNGVHLGVQTYSFRDLPRPAGAADSVDVVIKAMKEAGVDRVRAVRAAARAAVRAGRARRARRAAVARGGQGARGSAQVAARDRRSITSANAKKKFDAAGITITAYCYNMNDSFTDAEIDRGFEMTKALGANVMTTSTQMTVAKRIAPLADKHKIAGRPARPLEHQRPERVRDARELCRGDEDVEVLQGQPRRRPLHRRQLRSGRLHPRAPRRHHQPAPEGSQEEPGRQHAVGPGRDADPRSAAAAEEREVADSRPTSSTSIAAPAPRRRK